MSYFKPISISLSPNVEKDDVKLALNLIIRPWLWKEGKAISELENQFKKYLGVKYAVSFNSGRSAFYAILEALKREAALASGSDVLIQAFTCNAVPNPILWAGMEPAYVDCDTDSFNMDVNSLKNKIAENSEARALVVQHTFGLPANMDEIMQIAQQNNLIVIEDCAHALGAKYKNQNVGTFGRAAFFSFSRDKAIYSVYGGMAATNDDRMGQALRQAQGKMGMPSPFWIFQQLLHPVLLHFMILPIYNFLDLGKVFLVLAQVLHILSKAVHWKEKQGEKPDYFPKALPNALSLMALNQLSKIEKFNARRAKISQLYFEKLNGSKFVLPEQYSDRQGIFLRFPVKHPKAHEIIYEAWHKQNILLGDWYTTPIAPFDTNLKKMHYEQGSCPNAEVLSKMTLNLPTHINISPKDAERIITFLKQWK